MLSFSYRLHSRRDVALIECGESTRAVFAIEPPKDSRYNSIRQRRLYSIRSAGALIDKLNHAQPADWARNRPEDRHAFYFSPVSLEPRPDFVDPPAIKGAVRTIIALDLNAWVLMPGADRLDVATFARAYAGIAVPAHGRGEFEIADWLPTRVTGERTVAEAVKEQFPAAWTTIAEHFGLSDTPPHAIPTGAIDRRFEQAGAA